MHVSVVAQRDVGDRILHGERELSLNCTTLLSALLREIRPLHRHSRHARRTAQICSLAGKYVRLIGIADARSELRDFAIGFEEGDSPINRQGPFTQNGIPV